MLNQKIKMHLRCPVAIIRISLTRERDSVSGVIYYDELRR